MAVQNNEAPETQNGSAEETAHPKSESFLALTLGSVGVVYGDIGTSPLYALREALLHIDDSGVTREEVLGVVSLLLWALIVTVTIKYVVVLLHADNRGEGGTLSLMALAQAAVGRHTMAVFLLGVIGAALFYGDAIITPAISVLSAVEGLKLVTPVLEPYVVGITLVILIALFAVQRHGTGVMAAWFGPITAVWFMAMALLGIWHIGDDPSILGAFDPRHAVGFMLHHGLLGFVVLGSVFLAVTGAEALYADMGHFGRGPIQAAWMLFVFPALALNYLGQGAFILARPEAIENPFYLMAPEALLLPLVILATAATIIASQAVITGAFSITRQAIQLGLLPRMAINHTSESQAGQIYIPAINLALLLGVFLLVILFKSSGALASAYGISVTGTMVVTTALAFVVIWRCWRWPLPLAALFIAPFLLVDVTFLGANLLKVLDGGYVPLLLGGGVVIVMWTWSRGTALVRAKTHGESVPLVDLVRNLERKPPHHIPNTAMFLTGDPDVAPAALLHNLKHNMVLHERNVILTVQTAPVPRVAAEARVQISPISAGFTKVVLTYGFMESPNVPKALAICRRQGMKFDIMRTSFFLGRTSVRPSPTSGMPLWQDKLFIALTRLSTNATEFFSIPPGRVVEVGTQVTV